jgi:Zn-dependent membrane protease YugP
LTIPVERDASKRGIDILKKMEVLDDDEMLMAKDLLKTALLTYIGDFLRAILWWTFLTRKTKLF